MFIQKYKWIPTIINFMLVLLFVYTGISKLLSHQVFEVQLRQIDFLKSLTPILSIALPVTEIITGLAIALNYTMRIGLWSAALLMTLFTLYVAIILVVQKTKLPCTCGGVLKVLSWKKHLWFNIIFMCLAWFNIYLTDIRKRE